MDNADLVNRLVEAASREYNKLSWISDKKRRFKQAVRTAFRRLKAPWRLQGAVCRELGKRAH